MPTLEHRLRFRATLEGFEEAARALREHLDARRVDAGARYNVELAFEEVVTNIVLYGLPTSEIDVRIHFADDEIVLTFEDDGVAFDPRDRPDPVLPSSIEEAQVGGLGLTLLKSVLTRMDYERTPQQRNLLTLAIPAR